MTAKALDIRRGTRCGEPCPERLSGAFGALQCTLAVTATGQHMGDHRTNHTVARVGKVKISWKNHSRMKVTYSGGPPVVELREDAALNPYLTGQARKGPVCACPDWWKNQGSKMHHSPCTLV